MRLLVRTTGSKTWRLRYRQPLGDKQAYPDTSLKDSRKKRDKARALLTKDRPKQQVKTTNAANTFEAWAIKWFATISPTWSRSHSE